jgi:serine/threonine-protein kinase
VSPGADAPGLEVRVDSTVLGKASWGVAIPYDPGKHHVTATAPGKKQFKKSITLGAKSDRQEIVVGALEPGPPQQTGASEVPAKSTVLGTTSTSPSSPESGSSNVPIFLIGGIGIVGLGIGTYFGVQATSLSKESNEKCPTTSCEDAAAVEMMHTANRDAWIANVGIGVGVVGVGVATYLFFAGRGSKETKSGLTVLPIVGVREGGLSLRRAW